MFKSKGDVSKIALGDFDFCLLCDKNSSNINQTSNILGTKKYMSPESLKGVYSTSSDIWSCGIVMKFLFLKHVQSLISTNQNPKVVSTIFKNHLESNPLAKDLIQKMLKIEPETRISCDEALRHKWFKDTRRSSICGKGYNQYGIKQQRVNTGSYESGIILSSSMYSIKPNDSISQFSVLGTSNRFHLMSPIRTHTNKHKLVQINNMISDSNFIYPKKPRQNIDSSESKFVIKTPTRSTRNSNSGSYNIIKSPLYSESSSNLKPAFIIGARTRSQIANTKKYISKIVLE